MRGNRGRWIYRLVLGLGVMLTGYPLPQAIGIVPDCPKCMVYDPSVGRCVKAPDVQCVDWLDCPNGGWGCDCID